MSHHLLQQQLIYTLTLNFVPKTSSRPLFCPETVFFFSVRFPNGRCYIFMFSICFLYFCALPFFPNKGSRNRLQKRRLTGNWLASLCRYRGDHFKVVGLKSLSKTNKHTVPPFIMQIHTLSMSSGALKNQPKQKSSRALALPAPPPPRSLLC